MCVSAEKYKKIFLIIKKYLKEFLFHKKENNFDNTKCVKFKNLPKIPLYILLALQKV